MSIPAALRERVRLCPNCDGHNTLDAAFCIECGAALAGEQPVAAAQPQRQSPPAQRPFAEPAPTRKGERCRGCGVMNPAEARFCVYCGANIADGTPLIHGVALAAAPHGGSMVHNINYNYYVQAPTTLPLVARALWFVFIGLWGGLTWAIVAWLLNLTLIAAPIGRWMLQRMPQVMTLRPEPPHLVLPPDRSSASFAVRALYFLLIGWWISLVWITLAWLVSLTVIGLPLAYTMFDRTNSVTTLADV